MTATTDKAQFHTTAKLGPKRELTPEGYLVCYDVPLGRTGDQLYHKSELGPVKPDARGLIVVERTADEVFHPRTLASAVGKDLVDEHPIKGDPTRPGHDVNPANWRDVACGTIMNARRGEGAQDDLLIGDIIVKDQSAIRAILDGKDNLSLGYTADYEQIAPGRARQRNIIINHVALLDHGNGRCGTRCAIGDEDIMRTRDDKKTTTSFRDRASSLLDTVISALGAKDQKTIDASVEALRGALAEAPDAGSPGIVINTGEGQRTTDAVAQLLQAQEKRLGNLETVLARVAPGLEKLMTTDAVGDDEEEYDEEVDGRKTGKRLRRKKVRTTDATITARDSAHLQGEYEDVVARSEILVPGASPPAFDAKAQAVATIDSICGFRRSVLLAAWATTDGKAVVEPLSGKTADFGKLLGDMKCNEVRALFNGAAEIARVRNNQGTRGSQSLGTTDGKTPKRVTAADINAKNRETWNQPKQG